MWAKVICSGYQLIGTWIYKQSMEARNHASRNRVVVPARQDTQPGIIGSLESILRLLKSLNIRAQTIANTKINQKSSIKWREYSDFGVSLSNFFLSADHQQECFRFRSRRSCIWCRQCFSRCQKLCLILKVISIYDVSVITTCRQTDIGIKLQVVSHNWR